MTKDIIAVIILAYITIGALITFFIAGGYTKRKKEMSPYLKSFYILLWLPWGVLKCLGWFLCQSGRMGSSQK